MKPTRFVLPLTLLAFLSCNQQKEQNKSVNVTSVLVTSPDSTEIERVRKRKQIAGQDKIDSLFLDKILKDAITIAEQNVASDKFEEMYVETIPDSSYQVEVNINCDFYFSKKNPHFIIRRNTPGTIFIDVFAKINKRLHKVISHDSPDFARTQRTGWKNKITFSMFYHLEHHLFPAVPTIKLPELAKRIDEALPDIEKKQTF